MELLFVVQEDFLNYKKPSMFIGFPKCSFKCNIDCGDNVCQNYKLAHSSKINVDIDNLCKMYINNNITKAIVMGGLEPFDSPFDLISVIDHIRNTYNCDDDIVIYTGYTFDELDGMKIYGYSGSINQDKLHAVYNTLKQYKNIIIKAGRFIPGHKPHLDNVLGVNLASNNQYAIKIS